jgi:uncharacterized protein (TIGR02594 family)
MTTVFPPPETISLTAYDLATRFVGIEEINGEEDNHRILSWLRHDVMWPQHDEVPWCSAFMNEICWLLRLPRSKSLRARSWLLVGKPINLSDAKAAFDVCIFKRGGDESGPDVIDAPGHVGFYAGKGDGNVYVLGGNQGDKVCVKPYPLERLLGVRRLYG